MEDPKFSEKAKHADTVIRNHVLLSMGAGLIPVLLADIFAVSAMQLDMIRQLCRVYDRDFTESQGKAIVSALTTSTLSRAGARSLVKLIPGVGTVVGGVTVSIFAGASTYALGEVFKKHFESGGTILDFDPDRVKKMYKEKFEKGKKVAEELRKKQKEEQQQTTTEATGASSGEAPQPETRKEEARKEETDVTARLKKLRELHEQGLISDDEYVETKRKILEDF